MGADAASIIESVSYWLILLLKIRRRKYGRKSITKIVNLCRNRAVGSTRQIRATSQWIVLQQKERGCISSKDCGWSVVHLVFAIAG